MSEETKELTPEQKAEQAQIDRITAGVTAGVAAAMPKITEQFKPAPVAAPVRQEPVAQLTRPSEDEIADAMVEGNKSKVAALLRQQRAYDDQQRNLAVANLTTSGGAAIGSMARSVAEQTLGPVYKRFKKDIQAMVDSYVQSSGAVETLEMHERAFQIVKGQNADVLIEEARQEAIRKAREPEESLTPEGRRPQQIQEPEPENLQQILKGDWKSEFRVKQRETGGRSDDEELRKLGYRDFKTFVEIRKQNEKVEEETAGTFGLDSDWQCTAHGMKSCQRCLKSHAEGTYV